MLDDLLDKLGIAELVLRLALWEIASMINWGAVAAALLAATLGVIVLARRGR